MPNKQAKTTLIIAYIVLFSVSVSAQPPAYTDEAEVSWAAAKYDWPAPGSPDCARLADRLAEPSEPTSGLAAARLDGVTDGDMLSLDGRTVRLAGIDAPEGRQPGGQDAAAALGALVRGASLAGQSTGAAPGAREHGRLASRPIGADRYGRTVARVYVRGLDVGRAMVARGYAWAYPTARHATEEEARADLLAELGARHCRVGIWAGDGPAPVPPWEWRRKGAR